MRQLAPQKASTSNKHATATSNHLGKLLDEIGYDFIKILSSVLGIPAETLLILGLIDKIRNLL